MLPRAADGPTYYLCSCQGGNRRQPLPEAPAHHCPVHNNFSSEAVTQSVIFCFHAIKLQLNTRIWEFLDGGVRKCVSQLLTFFKSRRSSSVEVGKPSQQQFWDRNAPWAMAMWPQLCASVFWKTLLFTNLSVKKRKIVETQTQHPDSTVCFLWEIFFEFFFLSPKLLCRSSLVYILDVQFSLTHKLRK